MWLLIPSVPIIVFLAVVLYLRTLREQDAEIGRQWELATAIRLCPECDTWISRRAHVCPHCRTEAPLYVEFSEKSGPNGRPTERHSLLIQINDTNRTSGRLSHAGLVLRLAGVWLGEVGVAPVSPAFRFSALYSDKPSFPVGLRPHSVPATRFASPGRCHTT